MAVLDGIRVLDFGRYIAGPFCAALLADLGADVIRLEKVGGGEDRFLAPISPSGEGAFYVQVNRNKRGMTLNPRSPDGKEVLGQLVATADVVVANLPEAGLVALGLDYESLKTIKADIILTSISAFGPGGPSSHKLGFDAIGQAMSGIMYLSGSPGQPTKAYSPYVDFTTALAATVGTMAALSVRGQTGQGQEVKGSLLASALTIANSMLIEQAVVKPNRVASLNRSQTQAPSDAFQTSDGWVLVQCIGQPLFERWANLMGEKTWLTDPRFANDQLRGENGSVISGRMATWCKGRTTAEALQALEVARIPSAEVMSPQQALDDAHIQASRFFAGVGFPGIDAAVPVAEAPFKLTKTPAEISRRAPLLGEHTESILTDLGYSKARISALRDHGVI